MRKRSADEANPVAKESYGTKENPAKKQKRENRNQRTTASSSSAIDLTGLDDDVIERVRKAATSAAASETMPSTSLGDGDDDGPGPSGNVRTVKAVLKKASKTTVKDKIERLSVPVIDDVRKEEELRQHLRLIESYVSPRLRYLKDFEEMWKEEAILTFDEIQDRALRHNDRIKSFVLITENIKKQRTNVARWHKACEAGGKGAEYANARLNDHYGIFNSIPMELWEILVRFGFEQEGWEYQDLFNLSLVCTVSFPLLGKLWWSKVAKSCRSASSPYSIAIFGHLAKTNSRGRSGDRSLALFEGKPLNCLHFSDVFDGNVLNCYERIVSDQNEKLYSSNCASVFQRSLAFGNGVPKYGTVAAILKARKEQYQNHLAESMVFCKICRCFSSECTRLAFVEEQWTQSGKNSLWDQYARGFPELKTCYEKLCETEASVFRECEELKIPPQPRYNTSPLQIGLGRPRSAGGGADGEFLGRVFREDGRTLYHGLVLLRLKVPKPVSAASRAWGCGGFSEGLEFHLEVKMAARARTDVDSSKFMSCYEGYEYAGALPSPSLTDLPKSIPFSDGVGQRLTHNWDIPDQTCSSMNDVKLPAVCYPRDGTTAKPLNDKTLRDWREKQKSEKKAREFMQEDKL